MDRTKYVTITMCQFNEMGVYLEVTNVYGYYLK